MELPEKFKDPYSPKDSEESISNKWIKSGLFNPDKSIEEGFTNKNAPKFSMVLPPPNVTGVLHIGHATMLAIQDILARFNRMQGKKTLWVPGTDHAAIATQSKVEKDLYKKEKKTRHDLGREEFLKLVEEFTKNSQDTILNQIKRMGASIDWSRLAFTLDEQREEAVIEAFKRMYEAGLIYKGKRIVNWDPRLSTTVSDDEIDREERKTPFYYFKYGPFVIGTARPETKFGDKYVVMHPNDSRYSKYENGQTIELEWINGPITATIIKDEAVDMEFGTGVMTITPAHDNTDFEIAQRHNLDYEQIIDLNGKLLPIAGEFEGMHINKARPLIVEKLKEKGLLNKVDENYINNIAINSRGGELIEPQIMEQWFIDVNKDFEIKKSKISGIKDGETVSLKKLMRHVVETKQIEIIPERFEKIYYHWINNLRDWNISRQIWFGHRIPVFYKNEKIFVGKKAPDSSWKQDESTLDTWFSSGLWTFSTLGWPKETPDLETYHPTDVLETGYDILFFWVARMILMTTFLLGDIPFKKVYLHGLVRDKDGKKMSKSIGNIVDPIEMIDKFGTDAVRMSLVVGIGPGSDNSLSEEKIKAYKHFANKVWNASKFVLMNLSDDFDYNNKPEIGKINQEYIDELNEIIKKTTDNIDKFMLHLASEDLYHYFWHRFADVIIEESKSTLYGEDNLKKKESEWVLFHILTNSLKLLHPFMPFITEEIWSSIPNTSKMLLVENWPKI